MTEDNERDEVEQEPERERCMRPLEDQSPDIKSVIDEAVEAVEAVARRRGGDDSDQDNGQPPTEAVGDLQREVDHLRDRLMRTLADFDNYRKRVEREREDDRKYATVELLREIVGVVDNLERALEAEGTQDDLKRGVEMKKLVSTGSFILAPARARFSGRRGCAGSGRSRGRTSGGGAGRRTGSRRGSRPAGSRRPGARKILAARPPMPDHASVVDSSASASASSAFASLA